MRIHRSHNHGHPRGRDRQVSLTDHRIAVDQMNLHGVFTDRLFKVTGDLNDRRDVI